jgi:RimJ/RimL family protein N-acetyltransferase
MHVFLETDRLVLRRFTEADAELLFELDSDPEVMRYAGRRFETLEAYRHRLADRYLPYYARYPDRGAWAALEKPAREFIGWFILRPAMDYQFAKEAGWDRPSDVEVGYRLRRSAWGRGLATEGAKALVQLGLADPAVTCVVACALVTNVASCRVLEKAGLRPLREFPIPGYDAPDRVYAVCRAGCSSPGCEPCSTS